MCKAEHSLRQAATVERGPMSDKRKLKLLLKAAKEVAQVLIEGRQVVYSKDGNRRFIRFDEMDSEEKGSFLCYCIDWTAYINRGLEIDEVNKLTANVLAGKTPSLWLEDIGLEDQ